MIVNALFPSIVPWPNTVFLMISIGTFKLEKFSEKDRMELSTEESIDFRKNK